MRIAFLTPEFVTDHREGGGLGSYLSRMVKALLDQGHQPEVFVSSALEPRVLNHDGTRVERVPPVPHSLVLRGLRRICRETGLATPATLYFRARELARAMERRHKVAPYSVVQSADYLAVGLLVSRSRGRIHLVRCSSAVDLNDEIVDDDHRPSVWRRKLEIATIRRADRAYAPSRFIAEHFRNRHRIPVAVVRPPAHLAIAPSPEAPAGLPERFLVYFGQLLRRKGTYWLGQALARACAVAPELRMVWVGRDYEGRADQMLSPLGSDRWKVQVRSPLPRAELYALLQRAEGAVLPSLVDNLPNTVIECLMLGIPVIGTRGASIDELVEPGETGELVAANSVEDLAAAMVRVWRGQSSVRKGFTWRGAVAKEMRPDRAVECFLHYATHGT